MWEAKYVYIVTVEYDENHGFYDGFTEEFFVETLEDALLLKKEYSDEQGVVDVLIAHDKRTIWAA